MRILFINNDGGGFADYVETDEGTTVEEFFNDQLPNGKSDVARPSSRLR